MNEDNTYIQLKFSRCPSCTIDGTKAEPDHICPFLAEIHNDFTNCNCCDACQGSCSDAI